MNAQIAIRAAKDVTLSASRCHESSENIDALCRNTRPIHYAKFWFLQIAVMK